MKKFVAFGFVVVILGCAAQSAQTPPPAPAPVPAATSQFKNLKVFPKDIPRDQLIAIMKGFTRGLGVRCNHCHVVTATEPEEELDFPNDTKATKRAAREMIKTVNALNKDFLPRVVVALGEQPHEELFVTCWTCHRGSKEPEKVAPPPPPAPAS